MGFDSLLKRYYPAVLCALLAGAAWFQAVGITQLVAASIADGPAAATAPPPRAAPTGGGSGDERAKNGNVILARNPFDSVTGRLDGKPLELPDAPDPVKPKDPANPFDDPKCDSGKLLVIMASEDPAWSFATFASGEGGKTVLRRIGGDVGSQKIVYIGWDRVWLTNTGGTRCQLKLYSKEEQKPEAAPDRGKKKSSSKIQEEILQKIEKVSDTEFNVDRSVIGQVIENQTELMRTARVNPEKEGDKVVGLKLNGIRPNSLLSNLGLQNNDRLVSINGIEISDPQKLLEVYAKLPQLSHVTTTVNRGGKTVNIDFNVK